MIALSRVFEWLSYSEKYKFHNFISLVTRKGTLKFDNGFSIKLDRNNFGSILRLYYFCLKYGVEIRNEAGYWGYQNGVLTTPDGLNFSIDGFDPSIFFETFINDYHFIYPDLSDKIILNAGGFVGETALYYANKGATVYSFEPDINSYNLALRNMKLNPRISKNIVMKNMAVGPNAEIEFPLNSKGSGSSSFYNKKRDGNILVRSASIGEILRNYCIKSPYMLDLDVKGMEFEIIKDEALFQFQVVRIEYSTFIGGKKLGERDEIIYKLRGYGYKIWRIYSLGGTDLMYGGVIEARK